MVFFLSLRKSALPLAAAAGLSLAALPLLAQFGGGPFQHETIAASRTLNVGGANIQLDFAAGAMDLSQDTLATHIEAAAKAVSTYYGRFPVSRARILIVPMPGRHGVEGTTWGDMPAPGSPATGPGRRGDRMPGFTRLRIGQHATLDDLKDDWTTTHELVHMGFPSLPDDNHWMEEGLATYIEPLARVMTGELTARKVWGDMFRDMHQGEPEPGDQGLDHTHTWGRTYWGGALFCLVADVEIRRATANRKGLRDALQAIVAAGGTIDHDWDLPHALAIGDRATGTTVLTRMYAEWKDKPVQVDLPKLWSELGIRADADGIEFVDTAPLAKVREAIAAQQVRQELRGRLLQPPSALLPAPQRT